jgi:hypothetical protein
MTKDGGKTWERISDRLPGFPTWGYVSEVVPSRFDANVAYVTVDAHREGDFNTYIWMTSDMGATWRSINANLSGYVVRTLLEDTKNADVLYLGTETGLVLSLDRGKSWRRLSGRNFPTVRVDEMAIHPRDNALIVGTHGRALWILDHLEPIQEYAATQGAAPADAKLFSIPTGVQFRQKDDQNDEFWGHQFFLGENPPTDAVIQYYLRRPVGDLRLKITDAAGREIRELNVPGNRNQPGIQTVCWDMRVAPIPAGPAPDLQAGGPGGGRGRGEGAGRGAPGAPGAFPGQRGGGAGGPGGGLTGIPTPLPPSGHMPFNPCGGGGGGFGGGGGGGGQGPLVLPGSYTVALVVDGKTVDTKPMRVIPDPDSILTDLQRRRYYDVVMDLHEMQRRGTEVSLGLNTLFTQMTDVAAKLPGMSDVPEAVKTQFDALNKEFNAVRVKFGVPPPAPPQGGGRGGGGFGGGGGAPDPNNLLSRAGNVKGQILSFYDTPSDTLIKAHADLRATLPRAIADANAFFTRAAPLAASLKKYDLTLTVPPPVK